MNTQTNSKKEKFLIFFQPSVNNNTDVFVCCSILNGAQFVSILLIFIAFIYFYNGLYAAKTSTIISFILCLVYIISGGFLFISTLTQKYILAKISYFFYEFIFCIKLLDYIILFIIDFYNLFFDYEYYTVTLSVIMGAILELTIMSYFLYVTYCYLYLIDYYNINTNKVGAQYQELLKDNNENYESKISMQI